MDIDRQSIKRLKLNIVATLLLQFVTMVSGFILPGAMLKMFGSEVNGMVASITQLLAYISLLEGGVGGVVKAALYKPLADRDKIGLSSVVSASNSFFRKICYIFMAYLILLAIILPHMPSYKNFDYAYVFSLVFILGIGTIMQYYFSITYQILLTAAQRGYIYNAIYILSMVLNVVAVLILIKLNCSIHVIKLVSSCIFLIKPILINCYIKRKFEINSKEGKGKGELKQKWDGMAHHIAYFIHKNTDIVVLTVFSTLSEVSVYNIYNGMILTGIYGIISSITNSFSPNLGELIAQNKTQTLKDFFEAYENIVYFISNVIYSATMVLIVPFVAIYTAGINDADYSRVLFATIIVLAEYFYVLRSPYSNVAFAAGHFKQTKNGAFAETILNITISVILVRKYGIIGVAVGTFIAMLYRTLWYIVYLKKNILFIEIKKTLCNIIISVLNFAAVAAVYYLLLSKIVINTYIMWAVCGIATVMISVILQTILYSIFNRKTFLDSMKLLKK